MKAVVKSDVNVLVPNTDHKNFTETSETIEEGTQLQGEFKHIKGLRRGKPFTYRLFITTNGKVIYSKFVEPMEATEVTLGADSQAASTRVNMVPAETFSKAKMLGIVVGGVAGYMYAKKKNAAGKKMFLHIAVGAGLGYGAAYLFDRSRGIKVDQTK